RNFIVHKLSIAIRHERPDTRNDRNAHVLDALQKIAQLSGVKHWLRDRILRACFHLPLEPLDLFVKIDRAGIHVDADTERSRFADRIVAEVETMIQFVDHVRETDRVDIKHGGRVWIWSHLRRIAGDDEYVAQTERSSTEQVRHHAEQISIAT